MVAQLCMLVGLQHLRGRWLLAQVAGLLLLSAERGHGRCHRPERLCAGARQFLMTLIALAPLASFP
jgi:hypothetical protein